MKNIFFIFSLVTTSFVFSQGKKAERLQIANQIENSIQHEMLNK